MKRKNHSIYSEYILKGKEFDICTECSEDSDIRQVTKAKDGSTVYIQRHLKGMFASFLKCIL